MDLLTPYSIFAPFDVGGSPSSLPADLAAAIAAKAEASASLMALATGGVYNGQAKAGATRPYVVFSEVAVTPFFDSRGRGHYEYHDVRVACHEAEAARARALGDAVLATFPPGVTLAFGSGYLMSLLWTGGSTLELPGRGKGSERAWVRTMTFRAKVGRAS